MHFLNSDIKSQKKVERSKSRNRISNSQSLIKSRSKHDSKKLVTSAQTIFKNSFTHSILQGSGRLLLGDKGPILNASLSDQKIYQMEKNIYNKLLIRINSNILKVFDQMQEKNWGLDNKLKYQTLKANIYKKKFLVTFDSLFI